MAAHLRGDESAEDWFALLPLEVVEVIAYHLIKSYNLKSLRSLMVCMRPRYPSAQEQEHLCRRMCAACGCHARTCFPCSESEPTADRWSQHWTRLCVTSSIPGPPAHIRRLPSYVPPLDVSCTSLVRMKLLSDLGARAWVFSSAPLKRDPGFVLHVLGLLESDRKWSPLCDATATTILIGLCKDLQRDKGFVRKAAALFPRAALICKPIVYPS